jgi:catechol 2,3-dioxygenase-like lactoylglutathione lyase family enzyme
MLASAPLMAMVPVVDMDRARSFYEGKLGLTPTGSNPQGNLLYACGGATIALYSRASPTKADHTILSWEVDDIGGVVRELSERGVVFQEYDLPDFKTVDKVCVLGAEKAAWFKDTEGNILCIHEDLKAPGR